MQLDEIALLRLYAQRLVESPFTRPVQVVSHMVAMQAQNFRAAKWAVGVRAPATTEQDVIDALDNGEIVRSWPMRGTLHFTRPRDLRLLLSMTKDRTLKSVTTRFNNLGLDAATLRRAEKVAIKFLEQNQRMSRTEFMQALEQAKISVAGQRGIHIILHLAQNSVVCWGPSSRHEQALVLFDEWTPPEPIPDRDEVLAEIVLRYFCSHGPATIKDFVWWTKLTIADTKVALAAVADELAEVECDGITYWMSPELTGTNLRAAKRSVLMLPSFDEHLLGYQDRSAALAPEFKQRLIPEGGGLFLPSLVDGGEIIGTWKREDTKAAVNVDATFFVDPSAQFKRGLKVVAREYGAFLGKPVRDRL